MHQTYSRIIDGNIICENYALKVIERQANVSAANFFDADRADNKRI